MSEMQKLTTETRNPASSSLDEMSARDLVELINAEDETIAVAVARETDSIVKAVEVVAERLKAGGRLIYIGAGTSGRLGVLDASECPPTFSSDPKQVVGLIAGGDTALRTAVEGAEDHPEYAKEDLERIGLSAADVLIGIATSGRTPYVRGGLEFARQLGAYAIGFACNRSNELESVSDLIICPVVGPEVLTGSTRMKAGTATKMVLNTITTSAMVLMGKTFGNLMVDLTASNEKLRDRSARIVSELTGVDRAQAETRLGMCGGELKTAIVSELQGISADEARQRLARSGGHLRAAMRSNDES